MYEFVDRQTARTNPALASAFEALAKDRGAQHVIVRLQPDAPGPAGWAWLATLQHDIAGALRSFRYLEEKARDSYAGDPKGEKIMASVARHLATIEALKIDVLDRIFPADLAEQVHERD